MHEFNNSSIFYDVQAPLCCSRADSREPFSHSFYRLPFEEMIEATRLLWNSLAGNLERNGFTEDELKFLGRLQHKLEEKRQQDREWRQKRDLVLRCVHPDGCYFPYLDKDVVRAIYTSCNVDPIQGVQNLPLRDPEKVSALAEMLEPEIRKLERKWLR